MTHSLQQAQTAVNRALDAAREMDLSVAVVAVDGSGHVVASARMDGVPRVVFDLARRKAATSASFGAPLADLVQNMRQDPVLHEAIATSPDLILLPGAAPLQGGGAIGVGGGHYTQDQEIADRAVAEG